MLISSEEDSAVSAILNPLLEPTKFLVKTHNSMLSALAERFSSSNPGSSDGSVLMIGDIFCAHVVCNRKGYFSLEKAQVEAL